MYSIEEVKNTLSKQGALTIDMSDAFVRGKPEILYADSNAVFMIHGCGVHMLWAADKNSAQTALNCFNFSPHLCVVHGEETYHVYANKFKKENTEGFCKQYCLSNREKFKIPDDYEFKPLTYNDIPFIQTHYHLSNDTSYLHSRIEAGEIWAICISGNVAGFIGSHSDGSIGMLEVLPEYRRRGLGTILEQFQMNRHIDKGWTPYGQVFLSNAESLSLQNKIGLDVSSDIIAWL